MERDRVMAMFSEAGVETHRVFYPVHLMPDYRETDGRYPVAEFLGSRGLSLPTHGLMSEDDVEYIARNLTDIIRRGA
jgi:perosamine synthetase